MLKNGKIMVIASRLSTLFFVNGFIGPTIKYDCIFSHTIIRLLLADIGKHHHLNHDITECLDHVCVFRQVTIVTHPCNPIKICKLYIPFRYPM